MANNIKFTWNVTQAAIIAKVKNADVHQFMATTWMGYMTPYVPKDTGALRDATVSASAEKGTVTYSTPYARRWFYTNADFKTPGTGSDWNGTARAAGKVPALAQAVQAYIKGDG